MTAINPFLAAVLAGMQTPPPPNSAPPPPEDTLDLPGDTITPTRMNFAAPPAIAHADPKPMPWQGHDPMEGYTKPVPGDLKTDPKLNQPLDLFKGVNLPPEQAPIGPPAPTGNTNAVPGGPGPAVNVNGQGDFPLVGVGGGGVTPAHEVDVRGPSLKAAQGVANDASQGAIGNVNARSEDAAAHEYGMALDQERQARMREAAWQQSVAERDEEMQQHQADFDQSVKALSQTAIDPNRFWSSRSTGQKVSAMVSLALGGFLQGARGGNNPGMDILNTAIDRDVRAQEAQFQAARDVVGARQTAFSLAAQKYQNVDAARAMARAAAIDAVQGQLAQNAALWKGTDAANRADVASAALQQEKMAQIANGVRFILPQAQQRTYVDPKTGLRYTEAEAKGLAHELRGYEQKREEIGLNTAGDVIKEQAKAQAEASPEGLSKADVSKLALEAKQASMQRDAVIGTINTARSNLPSLIKGGASGAAWSHAPAWVPGAEQARKDTLAREDYNRNVGLAFANVYKVATDSPEPKRLELVQHMIEPYLLDTTETEASARNKLDLLDKKVQSWAPAKGAAPAAPDVYPESAKIHRTANGR